MRVAVIADPYVPIPPVKYGGTERVINYLIKGLIEEGHEPILLAAGDSTVNCELIPIVKKSIFFPRNKKGLPIHRSRLKLIERYTKKKLTELLPDIDIIHSHGFDLKDFTDFPNLTTLHGPITFKDLPYFVEREKLNYVSISRNQQEAYPDLNYVRTVYHGENLDEFPIVARPQNYVCFVGRFDREKNPHLAIQLAINLGIKIKLAGKIDFLGSSYFKEEVRPYLRHPLVEYLGEVSPKETVKILSQAKCNLHPTGFREPFGLTVLEAAYCGTPTLAIERGSMPELIEVGKTGMLVEDFVEGFHYIEQCFNMDREYIAKRTRKLFNYQRMTRGYIRAYRKVIREYRDQANK